MVIIRSHAKQRKDIVAVAESQRSLDPDLLQKPEPVRFGRLLVVEVRRIIKDLLEPVEVTSAGNRGYYHPVGAAEAGTETGASEILTVTAKSNAFDETAGEFYPSVEKITVTYYIQCSYKLLNTQWILNYDPEYLELIDEDEINYYIDDGDIEGYMMPFAGDDGVYNLSYRGKVVANTSSTNGYNISARCGYVSATFKPLKAGKTEVYLDTQVFTLKSSGGDIHVIENSELLVDDVPFTPESCPTAVYEGEYDDGSPHTPVFDPGYPATVTEEGLTDGTHCAVCGEIITPQEPIPCLEDNLGVRKAGHSLSLDGDIAVNYYMELSESVAASDSAYMSFTVALDNREYEQKVFVNPKEGENRTVADTTVDESSGKTLHIFKCRVAAKEMTADITGQIVDGEDSGAQHVYSVKRYADYLLSHTAENMIFANAAPLVRAMLNYGAYSQLYFNENTENLANADLIEVDKLLGQADINVADVSTESLPEGVDFMGATLSLKSQTTLSLLFKSSEPLSFSCSYGMKVETVESGEYRLARIRNIPSALLGTSFTLSVGSTGSIAYSPMNYCKKVLSGGSDDEALQNTVKALYFYYEAANSYFG